MTNLTTGGALIEIEIDFLEEVDVEVYAKANKVVPKAKHYVIRIDREKFKVNKPHMTGRQLLELAGDLPPDRYMISQRFTGGQTKRIQLDEKADFTTPGVERFITLPLDQTDGGKKW